jgi:hypothetical protein
MRKNTPKDTTALTARRSNDDFDCELPDDALDELLVPRRPRILGRPSKAPDRRRALVLAVLVLLLVAVGVVVVLVSWQRPAYPALPAGLSTPAPTVPPTVQPAASPRPTPSTEPIQPPSAVEHVIEQPILPPRAQLLKLPTPRAAVVRLPAPHTDIFAITPAHIDEAHDITMPYGTVVRATLRGFLRNESQLPRAGHIGDMYVVGSVPWIWIQVPGTTAPTWVDP